MTNKVIPSCLLFFSALIILISCSPDKQRYDEASENKVVQESQREINLADIVAPEGTQVDTAATGLTYPVDVTFDEEGNAYIAEAGGHTYGTKPARAPSARILKLNSDGSLNIVYDKVVPMTEIRDEETSSDMNEGLIPPITGVTYHEGKLYISHRSRYSTYNLESGEFETVINGLPSWGEFLNGKPIINDGKITFFLSTQGNSGVIEAHWVRVIDEFRKPEAREVPCEDITLTGQNYWAPTHKVNITEADSVSTGAYMPLGEEAEQGQVIEGQDICNGAFFRSDLDGSNIERIAWGLRSNFGYRYGPDGRLITTMNSANPMPPRGLYFDYETVYEVVEGEWYGWPDFYSGLAVTDERFSAKKEERKFLLTQETHQKLLNGKDRPRQPLAKLSPHSATQGMVFGRGEMGLSEEDILVAEFGSIVPPFKGEEFHPHQPKGIPEEENAPEGTEFNWPGFKVQSVNLQSGDATDFIYNRDNLPASANQGGGLERPIQLEWGPDGDLYIVDFGVVTFDDVGMNARPFTGVLWKVSTQ